ncbi:restriction endonuclease [Kribbella sp. NPDC050241]|uniref:restriction endonuclease n=1 Tax=Kribbella sp. NPDC050241 TaxID=3364115 RepID=UPI00378D9454
MENSSLMTPKWKVYQHDVSKLLASLGFTTAVEETLEGARGKHEIDVTARTMVAGINQLWVIECKRRKEPVKKEHVLTFLGIVSDVGADRGLMFSESGFQAGAIRSTSSTNMTLTSIEDFRRNTAVEMDNLRIREFEHRLEELAEKYAALWDLGETEREVVFARYSGPPDMRGRNAPITVQARLSQMNEALVNARYNRWPAWYHPLDEDDAVIRLLALDGLLLIIDHTITTCERIYEQMINTELPVTDWRDLQPPELVELLNAIRQRGT